MSTLHRLKPFAGVAKWVLFIGGLLLFAFQVVRSASPLMSWFHSDPLRSGFGVLLFGLGFAACLFGLALGWVYCLRFFNYSIGVLEGTSILGVSGLGKYIPGNVAEHLGRFVLLSKRGASRKQFFGALILEAVLCALACLFLSVQTLSVLFNLLFQVNTNAGSIALFIAALCGGGVLWILARPSLKLGNLKNLAFAFLWILTGFLGMSMISGGVSYWMDPSRESNFWPFVEAFPGAWLVGFFALGAPAGIGVREWAMASLLRWQGLPDQKWIETQGVLLRFVSVLGDFFLFLVSYCFMRSKNITIQNMNLYSAFDPIGVVLSRWRTHAVRPYVRSKKWMDLACGDNRLVRSLGFGTGIDIRDYGNGNLVVEDFSKLPLDSGSMDVVTILAALNYFDQPQAVLKEIERVLSAKGVLIVTLLNHRLSRVWHRFRDRGLPRIAYSREELVGLLQGSGLELKSSASFMWRLNHIYVIGKVNG